MKSQLKDINHRLGVILNKLNPERNTMLIIFQNSETKLFEYNGKSYETKKELEADNNINQKILYIEWA